MARSQGVRAGRAFIELFADDSQMVRDLRKSSRKLKAFGAGVAKVGARMAAVTSALFVPLGIASIKAASDTEETMNKFNVVFGNSAKAVKAWGDEFGAAVGRSQEQVARFLAGTQDLLIPLGFDPGAAESMSKDITTLATDLASFNNMADDAVLRDLHAAMTGSGEVMKKYGVIVSEAAVKQELLNQGLDPRIVTDQQKVMARLNIIMRGTTAAQGDAIRSAGSFANQMKRLRAQLHDAASVLGSALLPLITPLVSGVADLANRFAKWSAVNRESVVTVAKWAAGLLVAGSALVAIGSAIGVVGFAVSGLTTAVTGLAAAFMFLAANPVVLVLAAVAAGAIAVGVHIHNANMETSRWLDTLDDVRATKEKQRQEDQRLVETLQELANKTNRTNEEQRDAIRIVSELERVYGDLGITVGDVADKIDGVAEAQKKINESVRADKLSDLKDELIDLDVALTSVTSRMQAKVKHPIYFMFESISQMDADHERIVDRIKKTKAQIKALESGAQPVSLSPSGGTGTATKDAVDESRTISDLVLRLHRQKIEAIDDEHKRAIASINAEYDHEAKLAQEANASATVLDLIESNRQLAIANEIDQHKRQLRDAENRDLEEAMREAADRQARIADADAQRQREIAELKIRTQYKGIELEKKLHELRRQFALEDAEAAGENLDLVRRKFDLESRLRGAADRTTGTVARGTFNTRALQSLQGYSAKIEERIAKATEKTAIQTDNMVRRLTGIEQLLDVGGGYTP